MKKICENCQWWEQCYNPYLDDDGEYLEPFVVGKDFGCIHWEERQ